MCTSPPVDPHTASCQSLTPRDDGDINTVQQHKADDIHVVTQFRSPPTSHIHFPTRRSVVTMATCNEDQLPSIQSGKRQGKTAYMYRPPAIRPNYGKVKESLLPKTNMSRVLLFENNMQENVLNGRLKYIAKERQTYRFAFRKTRYAFIDMQIHRRKWHEVWENGYKKMTDAFVAKYGRLYTPAPDPEPEPEEVNPFFINARLAPPINILCFYLDSQQRDLKGGKSQKISSHPLGRHKPSMTEYLHDHERLVGLRRECTEICMPYRRSIEDPRFRHLAETLVTPGFETKGYIQLSPTFHSGDANLSKKPRLEPRHREITLPDFYTRRHISSRDSTRSMSLSRQPSIQKDSTFPYVDDTRSSFSDLSVRGSEVEPSME